MSVDSILSVMGMALGILTSLIAVVWWQNDRRMEKTEREIKSRIDKLEEVSRREDASIIESLKRLSDYIKEVDSKYRDNDRELYQAVGRIDTTLARLEERFNAKG